MKSLLRIALFCIIVMVLLGVLGISAFYVHRTITRPTMESSGGTILVYEVDLIPLDTNYQPDEMAQALQRRLDPDSGSGITVRPLGDTRVEINIPRKGDHATHVEQAKALIRQVGLLEFRILANMQDDREAIEAAGAYLEGADDPRVPPDWRAERLRRLEDLAARGLPPPAPRYADGTNTFQWTNPWAREEASYSWVELSPGERISLNLDNAAKDDPQRNRRWKETAKARDEVRLCVIHDMGQTVLYSRPCTNTLLSPEYRESKQYDYFMLTREPKPAERVTGQYVVRAAASTDAIGKPALAFRFSKPGGDLFYDLTSQNKPSGSEGAHFYRQLAIILDGQVMSAPRLAVSIRFDGVISGNFTKTQVDQMAQILRAGALPAALKQEPVSEATVGPNEDQD
jgi:preprotein translocase subunit SecD